MSEASKALAEVRGWLCDNLDASDAGHVCGMLSVVSRRVVRADELETENAELRDELAKLERLAAGIDLPEYPVTQFKPKDLERENSKLLDMVSRVWKYATRAHDAAYELCADKSEPHALATLCALTLNAQDIAVRMCELGIKVPE